MIHKYTYFSNNILNKFTEEEIFLINEDGIIVF